MNKRINEQKLLELYTRHMFEDRKNNLECIKARLNLESPGARYAQILFRRSRICYALSCFMLFLGAGIYGSYYWIIRLAHEKRYIGMTLSSDFLYNFQSDRALSIVYALLTAAVLSALILGASAFFLRKKAKNLKSVQQNGNTP